MHNRHNYEPPCSKDVLRNLYTDKGMSREAIAKLLGVTIRRIRTAMSRYGIEARGAQGPPCSEIDLRLLYESEMKTRQEIVDILGCSMGRVRAAMTHYGIPARPRGRSGPHPTGECHPSWRPGSTAYSTLHARVRKARGTPSLCETCGVTEGTFDWANMTGAYRLTSDYARLCRKCHIRYDAERRKSAQGEGESK